MINFCLFDRRLHNRFEDERGIEGANTELFPLSGGSSGARSGPRKSFENQRGAPRWPPARFTTFLQGPVTTSMRAEKSPQNVLKWIPFSGEKSSFQIRGRSTARIPAFLGSTVNASIAQSLNRSVTRSVAQSLARSLKAKKAAATATAAPQRRRDMA